MTTPSTSAAGVLSAPAAGAVRTRGDRLGTAVVASLVDDIVSGRLAAGDTLPTEAEIGDHFGVSRTVVRESIKLLQDKGLVLIHRGVGTVVRSSQSWDMIDEIVLSALVHNDESLVILDELVAVRAALEREMAITAAAVRTPDHLDAIRAALRAMERTAGDPAEFAQADAAFHDVVMTTSGNRLGRAIVTSIHDKARTTGRYHGTTSAEYTALTLDEHRALVAAIESGDRATAGSTMYDHITGSWARRRPLQIPSS
ncbi:FadR/GntR family transcriptional regulator [Actinoplanes sp. NPDC051343]|uniref:FadR/GntR family transcriptional regulator n=1 Tax=Actinoplanes sp. NPDC051343 TaxID=3363906 RepID=UPI0037BC89C2